MIHKPTFESLFQKNGICTHTQINMLKPTQNPKHTHRMLLLSVWSFWVNNFDIRNNFLSAAFVYVCVCLGKRKGKKSSLHVLFMCLSFICCLRYISQETFSHFKNSLAISEIIGQFLSVCWADSTSSMFFFLTQPSCQSAFSLSFFYCWQCVNMSMSATITIKLFCDWDLSLVRCHTRYIRMKYNQVNSLEVLSNVMYVMCRACVIYLGFYTTVHTI